MATVFEFELGDTVRDRLTRFEGVVTARTEWQYGCTVYNVQPPELDKDGAPQKAVAFDEGRLKLVARAQPEVKQQAQEQAARSPGGPGRDAPEPTR
jgi:hypothetical protein